MNWHKILLKSVDICLSFVVVFNDEGDLIAKMFKIKIKHFLWG